MPALAPDHAAEIIVPFTVMAWISAIALWVTRGWFGKLAFDTFAQKWSPVRIFWLCAIAFGELVVVGFAFALIYGTFIQFGFLNRVNAATAAGNAVITIDGYTEYNFAFYSFFMAAITTFGIFYTSPMRIFKEKVAGTAAYEAVSRGDQESDPISVTPSEAVDTSAMGFIKMFIGLATGKYDRMVDTMNAFPPRLYTFLTGTLYVLMISQNTTDFKQRAWFSLFLGGFGATLAVAAATAIIMTFGKMSGVAARAKAADAASVFRDISMSMLCMAVVYLGIYIWDNEPGGKGNDDGTWWTIACGSDSMTNGERVGFSLLVPLGPLVTFGVEFLGGCLTKKWEERRARK